MLKPANAAVLARNALDLRRSQPWTDAVKREGWSYDELAGECLRWMCVSQDAIGTGGIGCYEFKGWTRGYPEVTGYIIPTVWDWAQALGRADLADRATRMADWELSIQDVSGGFEGLYEGSGQPPVVFNTGQVIRGLLRTWQETRRVQYLEAARRAGDWIVSVQEPDGTWSVNNFEGLRRVYDTYVAAPLAALSVETGDDRYVAAAERNCAFALSQQHANGWFDLCDNTPSGSPRPLTHTLCYAIDGLLETGMLIGRDDLVSAARRAADAMGGCVDASGYLPGRLDRNWAPQAGWVCVTGSAQLGGILMALHQRTGDERHRMIALRLLDFLAYVQTLNGVGDQRRGALSGSYPVWEHYGRLKYPSWATKYFLDLLLLVRRASTKEEGTHVCL